MDASEDSDQDEPVRTIYDQKTVHITGSQTIGLNQVNIHNSGSKQPATPSSSGERQHSSSSSSDDNGDDNNT
ncbi:hypothetical protein PoB_007003400 [Plakobranchus ocellatus]|uniref:Uncharacterized protein n=1 Tax=Plakobranchus ocellatus TaxID=259542 RepID=A0AAV4DHM4_9GAST|nr:hypothetical protein PoB_007003400 [Plakobranchus ocellatus]